MKLAVVLAACHALLACHSSADDDFPVSPGGGGGVIGGTTGGGGGSGGTTGDGGIDADGDAGVPLTGRVCIPKDVRKLFVCDDTANASKVTISISIGTTVHTTTPTDALGNFVISAPQGSGLTWHVTGAQFTTSVMPFGTTNTIPVIGDTQYTELLASNSILLQDQQGSAFVTVVNGATPISGLVGSANPSSDGLVLYDTTDAVIWGDVHTGANGVVWFPDVPITPSPATLTLTPSGAASVTTQATIENQAITFLIRDFQ